MQKLRVGLMAIVTLSFMFSCATYTMEDLPQQPGDQEAVVYMIRPNEKRGAQIMSVYLDEISNINFMGSTNGGEYISFVAEPGIHTIWSVANNKARLQVHLKAGQTMFIVQIPSWGMVKLRTVSQSDGLRAMKNLRLGSME